MAAGAATSPFPFASHRLESTGTTDLSLYSGSLVCCFSAVYLVSPSWKRSKIDKTEALSAFLSSDLIQVDEQLKEKSNQGNQIILRVIEEKYPVRQET